GWYLFSLLLRLSSTIPEQIVHILFIITAKQFWSHFYICSLSEHLTDQSSELCEVSLVRLQFSSMQIKLNRLEYELTDQDQRFSGRTSLFKDQLSKGNASLLLTELEVQDEGTYMCHTTTSHENKQCDDLSPIYPSIHLSSFCNMITCSSEGIYPKPVLTWSTRPPSVIFKNYPSIQQSEKQLYSISNSLLLAHSYIDYTDLEYSCIISTRRSRKTIPSGPSAQQHQTHLDSIFVVHTCTIAAFILILFTAISMLDVWVVVQEAELVVLQTESWCQIATCSNLHAVVCEMFSYSLSLLAEMVHMTSEVQSYPDHPDRFDYWFQLLCTNGLTGRCYWEVEWRGGIDISVSYRGIERKGDSKDCVFGRNDQSWRLECYSDGRPRSVWHNNRSMSSSSSSSSSSVSNRVAVYVDCPAGTLSFYRVSSDTLIHLHTFNTTFTEPLYPGFGCYWWKEKNVDN
uniref:B30.2/SPRY domain-containing protein n=1 Tax=Amphilophus citrinellus TaxID=61819 RepID=A0A3Q0REN3_AMPCI